MFSSIIISLAILLAASVCRLETLPAINKWASISGFLFLNVILSDVTPNLSFNFVFSADDNFL